jgi:MarR family transcriptional regulator, transcriptional regulator for hemolysin
MPLAVEEPLGILFSDVARLFWRRLETALAEAGLDFTAGEMRVLTTIVDHCGLRQTVLAERLHIEPMTLVAHLDRLAARGLVERRPDREDRRAKLIHPTAAGRDMLARLREASAEVRSAPVAGLSGEEITELRRLLCHVRGNLVRFPEVAS